VVRAVRSEGTVDRVAERQGRAFFPQADEPVLADVAGEIASDSRYVYQFDGNWRLVSLTSTSAELAFRLTFGYYADGRRAWKKVEHWRDGGWVLQRRHQFTWDRWVLVRETVDDYTVAPVTRALRTYVWALDLAGRTSGKPGQAAGGIDGLVAVSVVSNGVTSLYLPIMDHQGTVRHVVDAATGRIVADFDYTPYGELVAESGDPTAIAAVPFRFQTKYYDRESGLLYFGHRYYAPSTGKWLTRDPLGEKGGLNLTQAFGGDPVNGVDARGLESEWFPGTPGVIWQSRFNSSRELFQDIGTDLIGTPTRLTTQGLLLGGELLGGSICSGFDLAVDGITTLVGGGKDVCLSFATVPLVTVERGLGFMELDTLHSYLGKHISTPFAFGFSQRWTALRRVTPISSLSYLFQELPLIGNFIPGPRGNMDGPNWVANSGGINADSMSAAIAREGVTRDHMTRNGVTAQQTIAPYDRGTATEVALAMFLGYKARALEWTSQIRESVPHGATLRSVGHSGGVIRSSLGSNYVAAYGIGVSRQFSEQGPATGFYNNIGSMRSVYSVGIRDITSDLGAVLNPFYVTRDRDTSVTFRNQPHIQGGFGSEWDSIRINYIR
jgi:RHS repeat-associated protein